MGTVLFIRKSVGALSGVYLCCLESNLRSTFFFFVQIWQRFFPPPSPWLQFPSFSSSPAKPCLFRGLSEVWGINTERGAQDTWVRPEQEDCRIPQHVLINNPLSFERHFAAFPLMHHHLLGLLLEHSTQQSFSRLGCLFSNCSLNTRAFEEWKKPAVVFYHLCNVPLNGSTCGIHKQFDIVVLVLSQLIVFFSFRSFKN